MLASANASKYSNYEQNIPTDCCVKTFINFSIINQLEITVNNNILDLFSSGTSDVITDIRCDDFYKQLKTVCHDRSLIFTINIDGVEIQKKGKSIWPILLIINELLLDHRYNLENIILAGVWLALHKPSRTDMKCLLSSVVKELRLLENGYIFKDYRKSSNNQDIVIKLFFIAACCDKPAQTLIQNIPEPIASFDCGRFEIQR